MSAPAADTVIVLGIDGLSPPILEPLLAAGELPAFARLRDAGTYRRLATSNPAQSPVAWTTIATGANPGRHGVFDFIRRDPRTYRPELAVLRVNPRNVTGRRDRVFLPVRHAPAFWNAASEAGVPTSVIRWPLTLPPDPVTGRMLAGLGVPDLKANLGRYTLYTTERLSPGEIAARKGDVVLLPQGEDAFRTTLTGPERARVALRIQVDAAGRAVALALGGEEHRVGEKAWSDWVRVSFRVHLVHTMGALCRFYLDAIEPELRLYCSPLQADPRAPAFVLSHPDAYAAELAEAIGDYHTLGMPEDTNALRDGCFDTDAFLAQCDTVMAEREKMLWHELDRLDRGLLAFVFDTTDRVQHVFWPRGDPRGTRDEARGASEELGGIEGYYRRMDSILGRVLDGLDERTALLVCSDHGFTSFRRAVHLNSWLIDQGLMTLKDDDRSASLLSHVDWSRTRAYALGFSSLYLNRKGREGRGIVVDADAPALASHIADHLQQLADPATGQPVVERVYAREQLYAGRQLPDAPDLIVGFRPGYRASWQTAVGGCPEPVVEDNTQRWCGDHLVDPRHVPGILFADRPLGPTPTVADIAPTVLALLDLPPPPELDGRSLLTD